MDVAHSVNKVPIRLTEERWAHIIENKPYMRAYYEEVLAAVEKTHMGSTRLCGRIGRNTVPRQSKISKRGISRNKSAGRFYYYGFYLAKRSQR